MQLAHHYQKNVIAVSYSLSFFCFSNQLITDENFSDCNVAVHKGLFLNTPTRAHNTGHKY